MDQKRKSNVRLLFHANPMILYTHSFSAYLTPSQIATGHPGAIWAEIDGIECGAESQKMAK